MKPGSLTGKQIKAGSLGATQIDEASLTDVTATKLASIQYVSTTVSFNGVTAATGSPGCPAGANVVGGGAEVSNDDLAFVNDSGPNSARNGWSATGFGEPGTSMTVTAICTGAAGISG